MSRMLRFTGLCLAVIVTVIITGCGGGGGTSSTVSGVFEGVEAVGTLSATRSAPAVRAASIATELNPNYTNCYIVPEQFSVALTKFELLKSEDDPNPYVVFDTGDLANPRVVNLTDGQSASFGANTELPPAGTYTYVRMTIVYFQPQFQMDPGEGLETGTFRVYASSVGNVKNGDIVQLRDSSWYWLPASQYGGTPGFDDAPFAATTDQGPRPDNNSGYDGEIARSVVEQEFHFSQDDSISADPYVQVLPLPTPIVIPANPTGKYEVVTTFDVASSDLDSSATGTFVFDDVDNDQIFEPGPGYGNTNGVGRDYNDGTHGEPMLSILPPKISMSFRTVE